MVVLSSFYIYIIRFFLVIVSILNFLGILFIRYFLPKEKSITYDLSQNFVLALICIIVLFISYRLVRVKFDKNRNILLVKRFLRSDFTIENKEILNIENVSLFTCKLIYRKNNIKKSIKFVPNLTLFVPFSDYPNEMKKMLKVNT